MKIFNLKNFLNAVWCCAFIFLVGIYTAGCETKDDNKLSDAQECLDNLADSALDAAAQNCKDKVAGLTSPASYVIRCSVDFFLGGVKSTQIANAFQQYNDTAANAKAAVLMSLLAQSSKALAQTTYDDCVKSEVPSLIYIATVSQTGTIMTVDGATGGCPAPCTDPAIFLAQCSAGGAGGVCDDAAIGAAVTSMYGSYCVGDAADNSVCTDIASAIASGGGDAAVAIALYAALQ